VRKSAFISIALHLAILLWVLVVFPSGRALDAPKIEVVPIDIVTPSETSVSFASRKVSEMSIAMRSSSLR